MLSSAITIVKKGSPEFKVACEQYLKLFFDSKEEDFIKKGEWTHGENKGKFLGMTSKKIQEAKLPMPFGCPDLFIQACIDNKTGKLSGVIWFCDRVGCICVSCREDFKEEYPTNCPDPNELYFDENEYLETTEENFEDEDMEPDW